MVPVPPGQVVPPARRPFHPPRVAVEVTSTCVGALGPVPALPVLRPFAVMTARPPPAPTATRAGTRPVGVTRVTDAVGAADPTRLAEVGRQAGRPAVVPRPPVATAAPTRPALDLPDTVPDGVATLPVRPVATAAATVAVAVLVASTGATSAALAGVVAVGGALPPDADAVRADRPRHKVTVAAPGDILLRRPALGPVGDVGRAVAETAVPTETTAGTSTT